MSEEKNPRYSKDDLAEFEALLMDKLGKAKKEINYIKEALAKRNEEDSLGSGGSLKTLEDGADSTEKESLNQLAARQQKFIHQLENALIRIKNGTYGVCIDTGKLISKDRLRAVPHTQHSIEAKLAKG